MSGDRLARTRQPNQVLRKISGWILRALALVGTALFALRQLIWTSKSSSLSAAALHGILNEVDHQRRHERIRTWRINKRDDLNRQAITAALVATVLASAFSWDKISEAYWLVKAFWYSSLLLALVSVSTAGFMSNMLFRLSCVDNWEDRFHKMIRSQGRDMGNQWKAGHLQFWSLQSAGEELRWSTYLFIAGLGCKIWTEAISAGLAWHSPELKIAIIFMVFAVFGFTNYLIMLYSLELRDRDDES